MKTYIQVLIVSLALEFTSRQHHFRSKPVHCISYTSAYRGIYHICTHIQVRTNIFHYWLLFLNQAPSLPVYRFKRLKCTILHKALGPFCILKVRSESLETILKGPSQRSWSFFERPFGLMYILNQTSSPTLYFCLLILLSYSLFCF